MELDKEELGRRIAKQRKKLKMKQSQLAEAVGVNSNHISSMEHDKVAPSLECFVKICDVYNTRLSLGGCYAFQQCPTEHYGASPFVY